MTVERVQRVVNDFDESLRVHAERIRLFDQRYASYRGTLERTSQAARWQSKLHPRYALQIIETIVANLIAEPLAFPVRPRPRMDDMEEIEKAKRGAEAHEALLRYQMDMDKIDEKQRPNAIQAVVCGYSIGKNTWKHIERPVRRAITSYEPGVNPVTGEMGYIASSNPTVEKRLVRSGPTFEVVDVRDFFWNESAPSIDRARFVVHRTWLDYEELEALEAQGHYRNVAKLKESRDFADQQPSRELDYFGTDRTKDKIEVLEYWTDEELIVVGNRQVELAGGPNPLWFDDLDSRKPFVSFSIAPDLFAIPGIGDVEAVDQIQEQIWTLMNQRIDNVMLVNNAIKLIRSDVDDPDQYVHEPGANWLVDDMDQVRYLDHNPVVAQISLDAEATLKGELQNVTGGMLFLSGSNSQSIDQETATGVSIVTSLAQKRLEAKRLCMTWGWGRVAEQWVALNRQFIREPRLISILGVGGAVDYEKVTPADLEPSVYVDVEVSTDSLMRSERRAEANSRIQLFMHLAPLVAQVAPLNARAFIEDWLRAFEIMDVDRYFMEAEQPMGPPPPSFGMPQNGGGGAGVTSTLASGPQSPSNEVSVSPAAALQRLGAMRGGISNA